MERVVEEVLECPVCLDRFEEPKMLPCGHTFCLRPCLENIVQDKRVRCPECRACHNVPLNGVRGLPLNLTIVRFLDRSDQQKLNRQCKECKIANGDVDKCNHCDQSLCRSCIASHTRGLQKDLRDTLTLVRQLVTKLSESDDDLRERAEKLKANGKNVKREISQSIERFISELQSRKKRLLKEVEALVATETGYFGAGQMPGPRGICSTACDDIVIADTSNHRIQIFDVNGRVKGSFGSRGKADGQFNQVLDVCVTSRGWIVAPDHDSHRIQIFDERGRFVQKFGGEGSGDGKLKFPNGVATDDKGLIYVCDCKNRRVQVFTEEGKFVRKFASEFPVYISVTPNGRVVVSKWLDHRVQVFDSYGGRHLFHFGSEGTNQSEFKFPRGVDTDDHGNMIVCDSGNDRVQIFTSDGEFVTCFGSRGFDPGKMRGPHGVCLLSDGRIAVCEFGNNRVQIF